MMDDKPICQTFTPVLDAGEQHGQPGQYRRQHYEVALFRGNAL